MTLTEIRKEGKDSLRGWKNWIPTWFWKDGAWISRYFTPCPALLLSPSPLCHTEEVAWLCAGYGRCEQGLYQGWRGSKHKALCSLGLKRSLQTAAEHSGVRTRMPCTLQRARLGSPLPTSWGRAAPPRKWPYWLPTGKGKWIRWM